MGALVVQYAERSPAAPAKIRVTWSEPANAADAATSGNYTFDHGVTVSAAVVVAGTNNTQVDLTVSALSKSVAYKITVANVRDIAGGVAISSPRNEIVFIWLGVGDNNLNGVPEFGGLLMHVPPFRIGDQPLGYNVLGSPDITSPTVANITPANGTNIDLNTIVAFDVTDDVGFRRIVVRLKYPSGPWEMVHDGDNFGPNYLGAGNVRTPIGHGFHYTLHRDGGWLVGANPRLTVYAIDTGGNEAP